MNFSPARTNYTTADEAVSHIKSHQRVFIHSVSMAPPLLIEAMVKRAHELADVELVHIHTEGEAPYTKPEYKNSFRTHAMFTGSNVRRSMREGLADYVPIFLSDIPLLFRRKSLALDVAMITVSPPDKHGFCSLGPSVDVSLAAIENSPLILAEVNPQVPRTHGDGIIHISKIDHLVESDHPLHEVPPRPLTEIDKQIGKNIAELVQDGATLQMGIGSIPDAVLESLGNHKNLGIHTEMFSDGLIPLVEKGIVNGSQKNLLPHKVVSCFIMGSKAVYDFIDDNPMVILKDAAYTNDTANIRRNPKVTAINSAIEIDLTGQVCADSIGTMQYSGVGGQMDFIRGAALSEGGLPIIAMPSTTRKGASKIVPLLKEGASVTTTRAHMHYVATEYGTVDLFGKTLKQRAKALISISHPDHREELEKAAWERFK